MFVNQCALEVFYVHRPMTRHIEQLLELNFESSRIKIFFDLNNDSSYQFLIANHVNMQIAYERNIFFIHFFIFA